MFVGMHACIMYVVGTRSHYVARVGLELSILMPLLPLFYDGKCVPPHMACFDLDQGQVRESKFLPHGCRLLFNVN